MAFTYIPEYSGSNAALNLDVKGVSIAENFPAANINNAMRAMLQQEKEELATLAAASSAGTVDITAAGAFSVSGTTTITAFTIVSGSRRVLIFEGALTLTHDGDAIILPSGASIVTAAGDACVVVAHDTNKVTCVQYQRADGTALVGSQGGVRAVTGTTDTVLSTDRGKLVTYSNVAAIAVTLPQATGSFTTPFTVSLTNIGAGLVTITPTTSTIDGAATITLSTGQGIQIFSDGTNYFTNRGRTSVVSRYYDEYTANTNITTVLPADDTIPDIAEGDEICSVSVTTTTATQRVRLTFIGQVAYVTTVIHICAAAFRDTTCVDATAIRFVGDTSANNGLAMISLQVEEVPGSASTFTYSVRAGPGSSGTIRMNGTAAGRYFGGASRATLVVEVIEP